VQGVKVTVLAEPQLESMSDFPGGRAGLLLATGGASAHGPRLVVLQYQGAGASEPPLAFIGKGITFDSGGLNVKPWKGMRDMYLDMMGAAAVVGAIQAIAQMKLPVHVVGVCAVAENAIGPNAMRPSDVVTALDGTRVEIAHTDAEGRLVLADALAYAVAKFAPAVMVDAATLTGSVMAALGSGRGGVFSKDDALANQLLAIGERVGEPYWRMPMTEEYDDIAESSRGDVSNIGKMDPYGDAIAGAYFLHHFIKETRWAHLDIASIDHFDKGSGLNAEFSSGAATRIFIGLAREMAKAAK
jgi:leucyl aminopeptidase